MALTFDAGSDVGNTARVLDILSAEGIRATFGITGVWAEANPALLQRMALSGHQVVNHSFDHRSFTGVSTQSPPLDRTQRLTELSAAEAAIRRVTGAATAWFRPPFGDRDPGVDADVASAGYRYELMWTVDSLGWKGLQPEQVTARCLSAATPGAIFLFHVGSASTDADALPGIIAGLRAAGYGFMTAAAMVSG